MALQFTDPKPYFAKPLALKNLLGERAFNDFKKLMDPCCGCGVDVACGGGTTMCPSIQITAVSINCQTGECSLTLVVTNANGPLSGRIQLQVPVLLGIQIVIDTDNFSVPGNGTFTIPMPIMCQLVSGGNLFDGGLPLTTANFFAYNPNGVASNVFSAASATFNCPTINECGNNDGKFCPDVQCVLGIRTMTLHPTLTENGGTFTGPFYLQTAPENTPPYTWTTVGPLSPTPVVGTNTVTIDITSLPLGTYSYRIIDSSIPPISSYVEGLGIFGDKNDAPQFTLADPCGPIIPGNITNLEVKGSCDLDTQQLSVSFDFTAIADSYQVEVFDGGFWNFIYGIGPLAGPGSYLGNNLSPLAYGPLIGDYQVRVMDLTSGIASSEVKVTFPNCNIPAIKLNSSSSYCMGPAMQRIQTDFSWSNLNLVNDFRVQYESVPTVWTEIVLIGDQGLPNGTLASDSAVVGPPVGSYNVRVQDLSTGATSNPILTTFTNCI